MTAIRFDLPATDLDEARTVWLLPDPDPKADPGWRFRLDKESGGNAWLFEEQVLVEKVDDPNARRIIATHNSLVLTRPIAEWLHRALGELIAQRGDEW